MSVAKKKIVLKKLKAHNTIWHPESTLIFKSQNERLVTGRYINEEIIPLDDTALELCESWNFKPDESLLASDEDDTNEVDNEEQEEEEKSEEQEEEEKSEEQEEEEKSEEQEEEEEQEEKREKDIKHRENVDKNFDITNEKPKVKNSTVSIQDGQSVIIRNLTEAFYQELFTTVDNMENKLIETQSQLAETQSQLAEKTKAFEELQKEYNIIKQKFDTMKSLFN
jgi:hypothetical protein